MNSPSLAGWEVEWCNGQPHDYSYRDFRTRAGADAFVRQILSESQNGCVRLTPYLEDPATGVRVYTAESIFIEEA